MCTTILAITTCIIFYAMIKMQQNWKLIIKHLKQTLKQKSIIRDWGEGGHKMRTRTIYQEGIRIMIHLTTQPQTNKTKWTEFHREIDKSTIRMGSYGVKEVNQATAEWQNYFLKTSQDAGGRRYGDECICIADSLCDTAETNIPL